MWLCANTLESHCESIGSITSANVTLVDDALFLGLSSRRVVVNPLPRHRAGPPTGSSAALLSPEWRWQSRSSMNPYASHTKRSDGRLAHSRRPAMSVPLAPYPPASSLKRRGLDQGLRPSPFTARIFTSAPALLSRRTRIALPGEPRLPIGNLTLQASVGGPSCDLATKARLWPPPCSAP